MKGKADLYFDKPEKINLLYWRKPLYMVLISWYFQTTYGNPVAVTEK